MRQTFVNADPHHAFYQRVTRKVSSLRKKVKSAALPSGALGRRETRAGGLLLEGSLPPSHQPMNARAQGKN